MLSQFLSYLWYPFLDTFSLVSSKNLGSSNLLELDAVLSVDSAQLSRRDLLVREDPFEVSSPAF